MLAHLKSQHAHCSPLRTRKGEKIQPESKGRRQGEDQTSGPVRSMTPKPVVFAQSLKLGPELRLKRNFITATAVALRSGDTREVAIG